MSSNITLPLQNLCDRDQGIVNGVVKTLQLQGHVIEVDWTSDTTCTLQFMSKTSFRRFMVDFVYYRTVKAIKVA